MASRCTGHCCKRFVLPVPPDELCETYRRYQDGGAIAMMVIPLAPIDAQESDGMWWYTCRNLNRETGDCMQYENRPAMCRNYPYGNKCEWKDCTMAQDVVAGSEEKAITAVEV